MAKGHTIGKTVTYQMTAEAAPLEMEDIEAQRLTVKEMDGPSAPKVQLDNLDRLVNWSNEFLGRRDNDRIYPVPIDRNVQAARGSSTTVNMNVDEEHNKGGQPKHCSCWVSLPRLGIVRLYLILFYIERGFHSRTEIGERESPIFTCLSMVIYYITMERVGRGLFRVLRLGGFETGSCKQTLDLNTPIA